jgi:hypothetical protein
VTTQYGDVQLKVTVKGGKIQKVAFVALNAYDGHSLSIDQLRRAAAQPAGAGSVERADPGRLGSHVHQRRLTGSRCSRRSTPSGA